MSDTSLTIQTEVAPETIPMPKFRDFLVEDFCLTTEDLQKILGVDETYATAIMSDDALPTDAELEKLADHLGTSHEFFFNLTKNLATDK